MGRTLAPAVGAGTGFPALRDQTEREVAASFAGLSNMDVSEAAFLVLILATKDMDDDLRMIMAEIKAMNSAKQKLRDMINELNSRISQEMSRNSRSENIENEKRGASGTQARTPRPAAKITALPPRRITLETKTSPTIHLKYVKAPVIPPLPPRDPGLPVLGLRSLQDDLKATLDGMNEMSEMISLRLQMTMDRRSKFIQTLSNIMKNMSTTQEALVQNIK